MYKIPNQEKYYTDGIDLYSYKKVKYRDNYYYKHTGWKLTYLNEWRFYIKKKYRTKNKNFFIQTELKNYIPKLSEP